MDFKLRKLQLNQGIWMDLYAAVEAGRCHRSALEATQAAVDNQPVGLLSGAVSDFGLDCNAVWERRSNLWSAWLVHRRREHAI